MKKKLLILSCCFLLVLTTACGKSIPKTKDGEEIIASLDGKDFTVDEFYKEMKKSHGYGQLISMIDLYIADKEIETTDELKEAAKKEVEAYTAFAEQYKVDLETVLVANGITGITTEKELEDYIIKSNKATLAIEKQIKSTITDEDIEKYYNDNYSKRLTVRHILIETEESDKDGSKAKETANKIIEELKKTDKDKLDEKFIELAKEYSDDSTYNTGGLIENFMSGTVVSEFWKASSELKDGEYTTEPVKTTYGYHVILRKSESDKPSLEDAKEDIKNSIVAKKKSEDSFASYTAMKELREKYKLKINDSDIDKDYKDFLKQLEEAISSNSSSNK